MLLRRLHLLLLRTLPLQLPQRLQTPHRARTRQSALHSLLSPLWLLLSIVYCTPR